MRRRWSKSIGAAVAALVLTVPAGAAAPRQDETHLPSDPPLPPPRPDGRPQDPAAEASTCPSRLAALGVRFESLAPLQTGQCGAPEIGRAHV
jgi:hypothetical protein